MAKLQSIDRTATPNTTIHLLQFCKSPNMPTIYPIAIIRNANQLSKIFFNILFSDLLPKSTIFLSKCVSRFNSSFLRGVL